MLWLLFVCAGGLIDLILDRQAKDINVSLGS
jgi:hypothetical protein